MTVDESRRRLEAMFRGRLPVSLPPWPWAGATPQFPQSRADLGDLPRPLNVASNCVEPKPGVSEEGDDRSIPVRDDGAAAAFARLTR